MQEIENSEVLAVEFEEISDFACHCGEDDEAEMARLVDEVCADLKVDPRNLVTAVVYHLGTNKPTVEVTGIASDMWAVICAETCSLDTSVPKVKFYIECDMIEHGFALLWKKVQERFPGDQETEQEP